MNRYINSEQFANKLNISGHLFSRIRANGGFPGYKVNKYPIYFKWEKAVANKLIKNFNLDKHKADFGLEFDKKRRSVLLATRETKYADRANQSVFMMFLFNHVAVLSK